MLYRKSQSLNFWIALAVGTLAVGQITPATANPKPMQQPESGVNQPIRSTTPNRTMELNNNNQSTDDNTPPPGANPDTRPTQSDGSNRTNPTDRRIYQNSEQNSETMNPMNSTDNNTPPAGANPDTRPTQSDGSNRTNPTDRRIYQNNGTTKPTQSNSTPTGSMK